MEEEMTKKKMKKKKQKKKTKKKFTDMGHYLWNTFFENFLIFIFRDLPGAVEWTDGILHLLYNTLLEILQHILY